MPTTAQDIKRRLEENWIHFLNANSASLSLETLSGATPPSVFVGRYGYPKKVKVGPMIPPIHGNTAILDMPEMWHGKSIEEIVNYRLSLVRGLSNINIHTTSGRYIESLQELAMASKSAESDATFEKRPILYIEQERDLGLDIDLAPFGLAAPLKTFKTSSSLSIDQRLENVFYDKDLRASEAVVRLYHRYGIEVSRIHKVLSMGMLGLQKNRRLVPTRWSISATDDIISANLLKRLTEEAYQTIDFFEVYRYYHLGNCYSIMLIPDNVWSFEMQEIWFNNNGNLGIGVDFENAKGLDHCPTIAGAYFAARLGVTEHLFKRRKKAAVLVLREIRPEYVMPVGVWQIREGIREALKGKGKGKKQHFDNFGQAISFACANLSISKTEMISNSKMYKNVREQSRITDYFFKNDIE